MRCLKCENEAIEGNYCSAHQPSLSTMMKGAEKKQKEKEREAEIEKKGD